LVEGFHFCFAVLLFFVYCFWELYYDVDATALAFAA
jgi:hypothetical protein